MCLDQGLEEKRTLPLPIDHLESTLGMEGLSSSHELEQRHRAYPTIGIFFNMTFFQSVVMN